MKSMRLVLTATAAPMLVVFAAAWSGGSVSSAEKKSGESAAICCDVAAGRASAKEAAFTPSLMDLTDIGALREKFNADHGHPRMIALLSPTCPGCIKSAQLLRSEILEKYKDSELKAYIVWLPMLPTDARGRWDAEIIKDPRAAHFWNEPRSVGTWFAEKVSECEPLGPIAWDVVYLFEPDTKWDGDELTAAACPTPVYRHPEELAEAGKKLLGKQAGE